MVIAWSSFHLSMQAKRNIFVANAVKVRGFGKKQLSALYRPHNRAFWPKPQAAWHGSIILFFLQDLPLKNENGAGWKFRDRTPADRGGGTAVMIEEVNLLAWEGQGGYVNLNVALFAGGSGIL